MRSGSGLGCHRVRDDGDEMSEMRVGVMVMVVRGVVAMVMVTAVDN